MYHIDICDLLASSWRHHLSYSSQVLHYNLSSFLICQADVLCHVFAVASPDAFIASDSQRFRHARHSDKQPLQRELSLSFLPFQRPPIPQSLVLLAARADSRERESARHDTNGFWSHGKDRVILTRSSTRFATATSSPSVVV